MADGTASEQMVVRGDRRRQRLRLEISREAARLFWEQGVAGTTGDQIAEAVGLSARTIWRHFRNKEACAEPIVAQSVDKFIDLLTDWPPERSMLEQLTYRMSGRDQPAPAYDRDDIAAMQMIVLGKREPALRTAWLMACDEGERKLLGVVATRMRRAPEDLDVRIQVAAASAILRVLNEEVSTRHLAGISLEQLSSPRSRLARALRAAENSEVIGRRAVG